MLQSESPSGMCAKLCTVAASNNRDQTRNHSSIAYLHHIYMGVVLRTRSICGELHIHRNANREVAKTVLQPVW